MSECRPVPALGRVRTPSLAAWDEGMIMSTTLSDRTLPKGPTTDHWDPHTQTTLFTPIHGAFKRNATRPLANGNASSGKRPTGRSVHARSRRGRNNSLVLDLILAFHHSGSRSALAPAQLVHPSPLMSYTLNPEQCGDHPVVDHGSIASPGLSCWLKPVAYRPHPVALRPPLSRKLRPS